MPESLRRDKSKKYYIVETKEQATSFNCKLAFQKREIVYASFCIKSPRRKLNNKIVAINSIKNLREKKIDHNCYNPFKKK